jgi:hypothetical protein
LSGQEVLLISAAAKKFLAEMMDTPVRDKTEYGTFTTLIVGGFAVLAYILRVIARLPMFGRTWGLDDWVMTATIVLQMQTYSIPANLHTAGHSHSTHDLRLPV